MTSQDLQLFPQGLDIYHNEAMREEREGNGKEEEKERVGEEGGKNSREGREELDNNQSGESLKCKCKVNISNSWNWLLLNCEEVLPLSVWLPSTIHAPLPRKGYLPINNNNNNNNDSK